MKQSELQAISIQWFTLFGMRVQCFLKQTRSKLESMAKNIIKVNGYRNNGDRLTITYTTAESNSHNYNNSIKMFCS